MQLLRVKGWPNTAPRPLALVFSPDGRRLAVQDPSEGVVVFEPPAPEPIAVLQYAPAGGGVGFAVEGLLVCGEQEIRCYDVNQWRMWEQPLRGSGGCLAMTVSIDGKTVWASSRGGIRRWDDLARDPLGPVGKQPVIPMGLAVSRSGTVLAGICGGEVWAWKVGDTKQPGKAVFVGQTDHFHHPRALAVSADGALVAATALQRLLRHSPVYVWDRKSRTERFVPHPPGHWTGGLAFHPHRPLLATVGEDGAAVFWDTTARRASARFGWPVGALGAVAFDPGGFRCAAVAADGQVVIWDVDG
jgi:WD40 repeat protein